MVCMLERIVVWTLVKSGHKQMGNYVFLDGRYIHKKRILWDFMGSCLLGLLCLGFGSIIYMALWIL